MNREHGLQKDLQTAKVALINVFKIMIYQTAEKFSAVFLFITRSRTLNWIIIHLNELLPSLAKENSTKSKDTNS